MLHHGPYYRSRLGTTYENFPYHQASLIISKMASATKAIQVLRNFLMGVRNDSLHPLFVKKEKTKKNCNYLFYQIYWRKTWNGLFYWNKYFLPISLIVAYYLLFYICHFRTNVLHSQQKTLKVPLRYPYDQVSRYRFCINMINGDISKV